jgi:hypothetical protein
MKIKAYIISASALIVAVYLIYWLQFYVGLDYEASKDTAVWGQLGDYVGGVLNPLLSFISIVLLIKSLALQYEANNNLKIEIKNSEKTERLRSFEVLFFNLISSQKNLFDSFYIEFYSSDSVVSKLVRARAVIEIEHNIHKIRQANGGNSEIAAYLNDLDAEDQIFGLSRAFYITVMTVSEKLSDANGFSPEDRATHFKALINFTDFAQLRLIMISAQFLDYESTKHINSSVEFLRVIEELGLSCKLY